MSWNGPILHAANNLLDWTFMWLASEFRNGVLSENFPRPYIYLYIYIYCIWTFGICWKHKLNLISLTNAWSLLHHIAQAQYLQISIKCIHAINHLLHQLALRVAEFACNKRQFWTGPIGKLLWYFGSDQLNTILEQAYFGENYIVRLFVGQAMSLHHCDQTCQ